MFSVSSWCICTSCSTLVSTTYFKLYLSTSAKSTDSYLYEPDPSSTAVPTFSHWRCICWPFSRMKTYTAPYQPPARRRWSFAEWQLDSKIGVTAWNGFPSLFTELVALWWASEMASHRQMSRISIDEYQKKGMERREDGHTDQRIRMYYLWPTIRRRVERELRCSSAAKVWRLILGTWCRVEVGIHGFWAGGCQRNPF